MSVNHAVLGVFERMESGAVTVRQTRCAKVRNRNVACLKCAAACTSGCISLLDGELVIDADRCVGCGTCATVCPTCALESHDPSDSELLRACLKGVRDKEAVIVCEQLRRAADGCLDESRVAGVVCLGRVDESLISGLVSRGVKKVRLACGDCARCQQAHGLETAELVAGTSRTLLAAWGSDALIEVGEGVPACALPEGVEREASSDAVKAYFTVLRGNEPVMGARERLGIQEGIVHGDGLPDSGAVNGMPVRSRKRGGGLPLRDRSLLSVMEDGTLPHFLPDRREKLLANLSALGNPEVKSLSTRLWGCVVIDGRKCSSCRMCATFCPTGALRKFDHDDGTFGIDHCPADCVKCGSCRDVCKEEAIVLLDEVDPSSLIEGSVHHYLMSPRPVQLGNAQQILNTMRQRIQADIFER